MTNPFRYGIQPIENHEMIFTHTPIGALWNQWNNDWLRRIGVVAVVDHRYALMGILRPHDILHHLIQQSATVHHLWPYTHVVEHSWADRLDHFDETPAGDLVCERGLILLHEKITWKA